MIARVGNLFAALWLLATGFILPLPASPVPQWAVALLIAAAELVATRLQDARWLSFIAGLWLIVAPFVLGYGNAMSAFNSYTFGLIVSVLAAYPTRKASYTEPTTYAQEMYEGQGRGYWVRR